MASYKKNAYTYATIVAMGGFVFGLDAALISGTTKFITKDFGLNELELGSVVGAPAMGVLLALLFVGYACNKYGRKTALIIAAAFYLLSAICSAIAPSYWTLITARFLGGLAFSSISMASMYIGEIAPPKWRGKLVSMTQINIVVGLSAAYFINYLILGLADSEASWVQTLGINEHTWRWMLGAEVIFALLWLILLFFIPRSPAWLVYKGRTKQAEATLRKLIPEDQVSEQIIEMQQSLENSNQDRSTMAQLKEIFSKPMRITFIIAMTIAIAQQATGINAILFYAPTIFEQLGIGTDAAFAQAIWIGLVSIIFTILGLLLVDKIGRRPMIIWGMFWIVLSLGICYYGFKTADYSISKEALTELSEIPNAERLNPLVDLSYDSDIDFKAALIEAIGESDARNYSGLLLEKAANINGILILIGILSFIAAFHFSVGPVMWVLFSEIFPISNRGIAIPFFVLVTSTVSWLVQKFFPWQLATMGISSTLLFYAIIVTIGLVILYFYLRETKNMTIEEVQLALAPKKK
ncbi:sugar porter family MFS transporter [Maribacter algarum]|uniref:Sugar porter family MFS transporter n=1 Tax=Maribacter algarum (ex Zhang et al. 2020) TaxID=2578118 RepID=A0A5S3PMR1_9FLAO|nr:sugar porter family MFS transporter [Maribacter algarum]TMM55758.1 sugar porter family MFS transporter [Maribacter algarum]